MQICMIYKLYCRLRQDGLVICGFSQGMLPQSAEKRETTGGKAVWRLIIALRITGTRTNPNGVSPQAPADGFPTGWLWVVATTMVISYSRNAVCVCAVLRCSSEIGGVMLGWRTTMIFMRKPFKNGLFYKSMIVHVNLGQFEPPSA